MSQKRERSINFTREEVDILVNLVEANKHVIENKKSDAVTWCQKKECWKTIKASFNAASGTTHRTTKNLQLKYEGLKRDIRKKAALISAETYRSRSVGGPSTAPVLTPTELKVKSMILHSIDSMDSNYDSDIIPKIEVTLSKLQDPPNDFDNNETDEMDSNNLDVDTQNTGDLGEPGAETVTKWPQWKPTSVRSRKHPALCKPNPKRPFEKVADARMEITLMQKKILEEEYLNKKLQWAFEEEERQHKREMWALEKMLLQKKMYE